VEHFKSNGLDMASASQKCGIGLVPWIPAPACSMLGCRYSLPSANYFVKVLSDADILGAPAPREEEPTHWKNIYIP
jgi:hypothetical protein